MRVVNLTVHGIGVPRRELEPDEARVWVSVGQFENLLDAVAGRPDVRLTFDDANESDVLVGLPRLLERGLRATFFVLGGRLGEPGRLTEDGVRELRRAGMAIGSHGWAHRDWRTLDEREADREMTEAGQRLAELAGGPVTDVSVPFGAYDRTVLRRLRARGARRVFTSDGGRADSGAWLQARTSVHDDLTRESAHRLLAAEGVGDRAVRAAKRTVKRWR